MTKKLQRYTIDIRPEKIGTHHIGIRLSNNDMDDYCEPYFFSTSMIGRSEEPIDAAEYWHWVREIIQLLSVNPDGSVHFMDGAVKAFDSDPKVIAAIKEYFNGPDGD